MSHIPPLNLGDAEAIDDINFALTNAGLTVHEYETDGDTFIDIWLTDPYGDDPATILSWRDTSGWRMKQWTTSDVSQDADSYWFLTATDPAKVAEFVAEELSEGGEQQ